MSKYARVVQEESEFGWKLHVDVHHQAQYYMHTYTGEIRWSMNASQRNFKMVYDRLQSSVTIGITPACPFLPQAVVMPSGPLVVYQPLHGSELSFPCMDEEKSRRLQSISQQVSRLVRRQPLPPTWEQTSHGFPFLPSFHVIDNSMMEKMQYNTAILHTTIAAKSISSKRGEKYQSSMSSERIVTPLPASKNPSTCGGDRRCEEGIKKEHNRRGYMIRQAKKLMRQSFLSLEEHL